MISQLASGPACPLTAEDADICRGLRSPADDYLGVAGLRTDRFMRRAGIIYLMRKGDRRDFAKVLAGVDTQFRDVQEKHYVRAFM